MSKPRLMILSFSNLASDARILRQVQTFRDDYAVTTCGFGGPVAEDIPHIEIERTITANEEKIRAAFWHAKAYELAYWSDGAVRQARTALKQARFDILLANDLDSVGVALAVTDPNRIHLDLHEYWVGLRDNEPAWNRLRRPYFEWMLKHWASRIHSVTTINHALAEHYSKEFGLKCGVVPNASYFVESSPTPVHEPLRLVHSGASNVNRRLETLIEAVSLASADVRLDLLLMGEGTDYHKSLVSLAESTGGRVRVLPPVPHRQLISTLNQYDIGLPFFPPTTSNLRMTLPNKLFDYVQARLGVISGPTVPIEVIVEENDLGLITKDFTAASLAEAIDALDPESVARFKANADKAAWPLSAEQHVGDWTRAIAALADRFGPDAKPSMIFHVPFKLDPNSKSASGIRPVKMRKAFEEAGYRVFEVSGNHDTRRRQMKALRAAIAAGLRPQFLYSESKTTPTGLGEPVTRHTSLSRDLKFIEFCRSHGIPTGLFYRDIYWNFTEHAPKGALGRFLVWRYRADLRAYRHALSVLFVPSRKFADYIPGRSRFPRVEPLPPGLDLDFSSEPTPSGGSQPHVFYVGGIGAAYDLHKVVEAVGTAPNGTLLLCVRPDEWASRKSLYPSVAQAEDGVTTDGAHVVHASGSGLDALYSWAEVGCLFLKPDEYRSMAAPMKLYEYLGRGKPIVTSAGTNAAELIEQNGLGWVLPYSVESFRNWLIEVGSDPQEIEIRSERVRKYSSEQTWRHRALEVAQFLSQTS
ncbi:glycosyltransferase [Actinomyces minihominis]|uniref:glycosyltransferase n=1 Tax=Actinomyces minihominis TaxID=2002838 RepID=UPI00101ADE3C|nr:glycosyltransferase [Actinomyces minihominis]